MSQLLFIKFTDSLSCISQTPQENKLIVLSFLQNLSKLTFPSSMVINLGECGGEATN